MLKKFLAIVAIGTMTLTQSVSAADVKLVDPNKMVRQVADNTFARIKKDQPLIVKDQEQVGPPKKLFQRSISTILRYS